MIDNLEYEDIHQPTANCYYLESAKKDIYKKLGKEMWEVGLIFGVIESAVKTNDISYFEGPSYSRHCGLLGLDGEELYQRMRKQRLLNTDDYRLDSEYKGYRESKSDIVYCREVLKMSQKDIAAKYGVSPRTVMNVLNLEYKYSQEINGNERNIRDAYLAGDSLNVITSTYNIARSTIYKAIEGLPRRKRNKT